MAGTALNKAALHRERDALATYRRYLPSLDLKRRQLVADLARARSERDRRRAEVEAHRARVANDLPMLANPEIDLRGLVRIARVETGEVNELGVLLPTLVRIGFAVRDYGLLAKPHWVDAVVLELQRAAELRLRLEIDDERVRRLEAAVRKTTQRVNLFDKVLIPNARSNLQRIGIFLADAERAAVVRSKIAKRKHAAQRATRRTGMPGEPGR